MNWYKLINSFYTDSLWNKGQVWDAVSKGKITERQYTDITGDAYPSERPIEQTV